MSISQDNSTDERQLTSSDQLKSLWRNRDYLLLWSGQALSDIGGAVSELAFPLLVLTVTHSPAQAGFVAALRALPATLFSLFAAQALVIDILHCQLECRFIVPAIIGPVER